MDNTKTLEMELEDVNERTSKLSVIDPKDDLVKEDIVNFEQLIIAGEVFLGPTGAVKKISRAYIREVNIRELI
ncbi:DUF2922 family protein [Anaerosphaera multitolerans]|uniref:DUF2922 domain-containing protein n=1 Tax=Anaerosphaera multitolerans TaxID=2487351 RepID=A0A437S7J3_9FIRM|nr:DUF2922 family protein [Anaerosphaera multitolerans]RVU55049.1 DUF2922 domain-containing protein [Anaerosphaera multitolerans]